MPWDANTSEGDPEAKVRIFDQGDHALAVCKVAEVLRAADPNLTGVSINDVSARKQGLIAVAAVYVRARGNPIAVLLYFDWSGSLRMRLVLKDRPEIEALEIAEDGQLWALNDFDPENRTRYVFTNYDRSGSVIREAVTCRRHWSTNENMRKGGQVSFGIVNGKVWTWLPESKTLISFHTRTGRSTSERTGLPSLGKNLVTYARRAALLPNGQLLMDLSSLPRSSGGLRAAWFLWSSGSRWQEVQAAGGNIHFSALYGIDRDQMISASAAQPSRDLIFRSEGISHLH